MHSFEAIFARVFVGATPTETGMDVYFQQARETSRAKAAKSTFSIPVRSRKASSMEYCSTAGAKLRSTSCTRRDMSPYSAKLDEKTAT